MDRIKTWACAGVLGAGLVVTGSAQAGAAATITRSSTPAPIATTPEPQYDIFTGQAFGRTPQIAAAAAEADATAQGAAAGFPTCQVTGTIVEPVMPDTNPYYFATVTVRCQP